MPDLDTIDERLTDASLRLAPLDEWEENLPESWDKAVEWSNERWGLDNNPNLDYERKLDVHEGTVTYTISLPLNLRDITSENPVQASLSISDVDRDGEEAVFIAESRGEIDLNFMSYIFSQSHYFDDYIGTDGNSAQWRFKVPVEEVEEAIEDRGESGNFARLNRFLEDPESYYIENIPYADKYVDFIGERGSTVDEVKEEYPDKLPGKRAIRSHLNDLVDAGVLENRNEKKGSQSIYVRPEE